MKAVELEKFSGYLAKELKNVEFRCELAVDGVVITVAPEYLLRTLAFLKDNGRTMFKQLVDICGVDYPNRARRFEVVYNLLSFKHNMRVRVKICVAENEEIPSAARIFNSAVWFEREVWDMYGVAFKDSPDLRRILTDYGFQGHPQRKDFPLTGYVEVRYDDEKKRVVYEPVKLDQGFRSFDFLSPWEGANYPLPGDEKATKVESK